jgi:hypothetical protein
MSSDINTKTNIPPDAEVRDKAAASQEEIYLEEIEEEVRATLTTDDPSPTAEYWRKKREELELGWRDR